jgi:hypothetical protein
MRSTRVLAACVLALVVAAIVPTGANAKRGAESVTLLNRPPVQDCGRRNLDRPAAYSGSHGCPSLGRARRGHRSQGCP